MNMAADWASPCQSRVGWWPHTDLNISAAAVSLNINKGAGCLGWFVWTDGRWLHAGISVATWRH